MSANSRNLITDVPGLVVGNADDGLLKSGVTVVTAEAPFVAGVHIMGGAPGTRETDLLRPGTLVSHVDALVLSGGSAFGLAAADGVMRALRKAGRGFPVGDRRIPVVPAAILYDLAAGGDHDWTDTPYPDLGRAAFNAASADISLGSYGAGTGATAGRLKGGLGSASETLENGTTIGALVAANPLGAVAHPKTGHFWAAAFEQYGEFGGRGVAGTPMPDTREMFGRGATTLAIVATDVTLDVAQCTRLATMAHDGMARAILPSHTPFDGDLVFALSTETRPPPDTEMLAQMGHAAATCLARAIARAIYLARPAPGDRFPCWRDLYEGSIPS